MLEHLPYDLLELIGYESIDVHTKLLFVIPEYGLATIGSGRRYIRRFWGEYLKFICRCNIAECMSGNTEYREKMKLPDYKIPSIEFFEKKVTLNEIYDGFYIYPESSIFGTIRYDSKKGDMVTIKGNGALLGTINIKYPGEYFMPIDDLRPILSRSACWSTITVHIDTVDGREIEEIECIHGYIIDDFIRYEIAKEIHVLPLNEKKQILYVSGQVVIQDTSFRGRLCARAVEIMHPGKFILPRPSVKHPRFLK